MRQHLHARAGAAGFTPDRRSFDADRCSRKRGSARKPAFSVGFDNEPELLVIIIVAREADADRLSGRHTVPRMRSRTGASSSTRRRGRHHAGFCPRAARRHNLIGMFRRQCAAVDQRHHSGGSGVEHDRLLIALTRRVVRGKTLPIRSENISSAVAGLCSRSLGREGL